jgi:hypothetical protein
MESDISKQFGWLRWLSMELVKFILRKEKIGVS